MQGWSKSDDERYVPQYVPVVVLTCAAYSVLRIPSGLAADADVAGDKI